MKIIRYLLGKIILMLNSIFSPTPLQRSEEKQNTFNAQTKSIKLYQFEACPFCVKVRRAIKRMNLSIDTRDVKNEGPARTELLNNGGKIKVPCLRIESANNEVQWMYESSTIIDYLQKRFA